MKFIIPVLIAFLGPLSAGQIDEAKALFADLLKKRNAYQSAAVHYAMDAEITTDSQNYVGKNETETLKGSAYRSQAFAKPILQMAKRRRWQWHFENLNYEEKDDQVIVTGIWWEDKDKKKDYLAHVGFKTGKPLTVKQIISMPTEKK